MKNQLHYSRQNNLLNNSRGSVIFRNAIGILFFVLLAYTQPGIAQTNNYFGTSGTITGSVWNTNPAGPYTNALVTTGGPILNFNNAGIATGGSIATTVGINFGASLTWSAGGTMGAAGINLPINVDNGISQSLGSQSFSTSGSAAITKNGAGELAMNGGTFAGGFTLNTGTLAAGGVNALGNGALTINGGTISGTATRDFTGKFSGITVGGDFTLGATTGLSLSTANLTFSNNMALGATTRTITIGGTGTYLLGGIISGTGTAGLTVNSTAGGVLRLTNVNTYPGITTLTSGELRLNPSGNNTLSGACTFNGGKLATTGITATRAITFSSINISDNSTLALASATAHTVTFTSAGSFTSGILTITGWSGTYINGTTGTGGKVFIGSTAFLTAAQLSNIVFNNGTNNFSATQLSTGEIVPTLNLIVTNPGGQFPGIGFNVTVAARNADGGNVNVGGTTGITLTSNGNAGAIGGTTTGSITLGSASTTISGVILPGSGTGVTITATRSSGDNLLPGTSGTFDVAANAPLLTANALASFGNVCLAATVGPNSFTITGTDLTAANVTVAALSGFTYSTTSNGTYTNSLSLTQPGGSYSQQIFVKFNPALPQSYNGNIVVGGGSATPINVAASGTGVSYPSITAASASPNPSCSGSNIALLSNPTPVLGSGAVGTSTGSSVSGNSPYRSAISTEARVQYIYTAAELSGIGMVANSNINSLAFNVTTLGSGTMFDYTISIAATATTSFSSTSYLTGTFIPVYGPQSYTAVSGVNTHTFSAPFTWNGTSGIVINICYNRNITGGATSVVSINTPGGNPTNGDSGSGECASSTGTLNTGRPIITYGYSTNPNSNIYDWSWSPGGSTSNNPTVNPTADQLYTVTATTPGSTCSVTSDVNVTVNQPSVAPTGISGTTTLCSGDPTTLTATGGTPGTGANYQWGTGAVVGTSPLFGQTASTLNVSPAGNTTYWVRIENTTAPCTGNTGGVTQLVTVNQPSTAPTGISGTTTLCNGDPTTLTAMGGTPGTGANYQWGTGSTPGVNPLSGQTASTLNVSPISNTTYWVWIENTAAPCTGTTGGVTQLVTVNQPSVAPTGISGTTTLCSGDPTTLTATGGNPGTGANYQWGTGAIVGTSPLFGQTASTLNVSPIGNTTYWVRIENTAAPCTGNTGGVTQLVTVYSLSTAPTSITSNDPDNEICSGSPVLLTANGGALGSSPGTSYKWYEGGCGTGSVLGSSATLNLNGGIGNPPVPSVGTHTYYVRIEDPCGNTSCSSLLITVISGPPAANTISAINGAPGFACSGTVVLLTATSAGGPGITYSWNNGSGSNPISYSNNIGGPFTPGPFTTTANQVYAQFGAICCGQSGYHACVQAVNACGSTSNKCAAWVQGQVSGPASINPPTAVTACPNDVKSYTCGSSTGATVYNWTLSGSAVPITSGQGSTSVQVTFPAAFTSGSLCVTAALTCGGTSTSAPRCMTISKTPATPFPIAGPSTICPGATNVSYSIPVVAGATGYNWTVPAGVTITGGQNTTSITVNFPTPYNGAPSICVTALNSPCANSAGRCLSVYSGIPSQPAAISGPLFNLCGSTVQYSVVNPVAGLTYTWANPAGTTISSGQNTSAIQLSVSSTFYTGTLSVVANSLVCPPATSLPRVSSGFWGRPNTPGVISQSGTLCQGFVNNFSVVNQVPGPIPTYQWTSSNGVINAGQGSNNIDVTWGSNASGTITVNASNTCGSNTAPRSQVFTTACREEGTNTSSATAFSVYPNPAHDKITVSIDVKEQAQFNVKLRDMSGRVILSEDHQAEEGLNAYNMDMKGFAKGIYTMEVQSANDSWKTKVIIE